MWVSLTGEAKSARANTCIASGTGSSSGQAAL